MKQLIYLLFLLVTISCKKSEIPVEKHLPGDSVVNSVNMGNNYKKHSFFDLKTNRLVSEVLKISWDLGFESGVNGNHVILNSSNGMAVARVSNVAFNAINDTLGLVWKWDASSGDLDSTAIGSWETDNFVYVINRGSDYLGNHRGLCKLAMQSVSATQYTFKVANLDGSLEEQITVNKDSSVNFTAFSLTTRAVEIVEPPKEEWDFQFTQYVHYFEFFLGVYGESYVVTGVLTNRNGVEVAEVFTKSYESISMSDVSSANFSSTIDVIGYDWKEFNFSTGIYEVYSEKNYIIKSTEGVYYKLHFIDFYNQQGDKGVPTFEFQEL